MFWVIVFALIFVACIPVIFKALAAILGVILNMIEGNSKANDSHNHPSVIKSKIKLWSEEQKQLEIEQKKKEKELLKDFF